MQLIAECETDHIYSADPFNEMAPQYNTPEYLSAVSQSILKGMEKADSKGITELDVCEWGIFLDKTCC